MLLKKLSNNVQLIKNNLAIDKSFDIIIREIKVANKKAILLFVDGLSKDDMLWYILDRLQSIEEEPSSINELIINNISYIEVESEKDLDKIIDNVLSGMSAIIIDGFDEAIMLDTRTYPARSPEEPDLEKVTRGSRDGLVETIVFNTALIRRRLRDPNLIFEMIKIGKRSKTDVCISYIDGLPNEELLKHVKQKLESINVEALTMNEKTLEEAIFKKQPFNPFPTIRYSERPDVVSAHLLEGHIAIIVDNSPSVMLLPTTFFYYLQHAEDYIQKPLVGNYIRIIRYLYILASFLLIPLWLLGVKYVDMLPEYLEFLGPKESVEIPLFVQFLILEFGFDGLKIASIHTPNTLSTSLGIIGGLLLGQLAIEVGWLTPETILYMALVAIGQFSTPSIEFSYAIRIVRLLLIILTGLFNIYGFIFGVLLTFIIILTTKTITGYKYLYPLIPFDFQELKRIILRLPISSMQNRK